LATAKQSPTWPTAAALAALEKDLARRRAPGAGMSGEALLQKFLTLPAGDEWGALYAAQAPAIQAEAERQGIELDPSPLRNLSGIDRVRAALERQFPKKNP
jgi:hypothetical protein